MKMSDLECFGVTRYENGSDLECSGVTGYENESGWEASAVRSIKKYERLGVF